MTRILIIEDDEDIAFIEKDYLEVSGYQVTVEINGIKGLTEALTGEYDLILLDVMLPGMDGFQICRKLRNKLDIPIMMVTAKRTEIDQIRGLGFGADDYIEKPFSPGVLVAKVKSQLSQYERLKGKPKAGQRITLGDISLEQDTHRVFVRGEDSFVRAQWAARPFVWQIYPQSDTAHHDKLEAFLARYLAGLPPAPAAALGGFWRAWNGCAPAGLTPAAAWPAFADALPALGAHARAWCDSQAAMPDLARRLTEFCFHIKGGPG